MEKLIIINIIFLLAILPIFYLRRTYFRRNIFLGRFIGNYIFIAHYIFFLLVILAIINYFFYSLSNINILTVGLLILPIFFVYAYYNFSKVKIVRCKIVVEDSKQGKRLKIGFISDVHLSSLTNKDSIEESLEKISDENVDVLFIGGDLIDFSHKDIKADFSKSFRNIEPKFGMYAVLGNHEYHGEINGNIDYIKSLGIKILRDEIIEVEGVNVIGRDDVTNTNRKSISSFISDNNLKSPIVVIDHNPNSIEEAIEAKVNLELCGHTHRGQFFPYNLIVKKMYKNHYGHEVFGKTHTIVSAGFSSWLIPYRVNSTSELNIIDLYY